MPAIALVTKDIWADYDRLFARGIIFRGLQQNYGVIISTVLEDTCGNVVNLVQPLARD